MNNINYNINKLTPFKFFCLTNFPFIEEDFDALTSYELLCKIVEYLNNVIDTTNAIGTQTEELTNAFNELKNYVDNYFTNLDVQEEINNKLDQMAESGELQEIIGKYLSIKSLLAFDNIQTMKDSPNIINGSYAKTLGFNSLNDGGSKTYKIIQEDNAENVNNRTKINLGHDNLYAISIDDCINVKSYGAVGDGLNDDTDAIQFCIDNFPHRTLYFPSGNYLISQTLNIKSGNENQVNFYMEHNARIFTNTPLQELLNIGGTISGTWNRNNIGNIVTIYGGTFDAHNTQRAIYLSADRKQTRLLNLNIINTEVYGIYIDRNLGSTSISTDALLDTISITGNGDYSLNNTGIYLYGTDNELNNIRVTSIKYAIDINGGGNLFNNVHLTCGYQNITTQMINNSIGTIIRGFGVNYFNNYYTDTYGICFDLRNDNMRSFFNNCQVFYYQTDSNSNYIVFNFQARSYIRCTNCYFEMPENSGSNKVTNFTSDVEYNTRKYPSLKRIARFNNSNAIRVSQERDLYNEITLNNDYDNSYNVNYNPWSVTMEQNKWYKALLLSGGFHKFIVQIANDQISEVEIYVSSSAPKITVKDLYHTTGGHYQKYNIGLANGFTDDTDNYFAYLVFQATDTDSSLNIKIMDVANTWATQKYAVGSISPLDNPSIISQSNLLPN